jgi:hypothetical protein
VTGDEPRGPDPAGLLFRHVVEERARRLFPPGGRILILPSASSEAAAPFDAAYAAPGALDGADLEALGRSLAAALRPGAPVLLCVKRRRSGAGRAGLREARVRLGPGFAWSASFGLGVLLPGPEWARRHPQAFGILAALESVVRRRPVFRALGDYAALEGSRRADRAPDTL